VEKILFVTNDFGPRAGGIETFIIGLIERLPKNSVTVYTSAQNDTQAYDHSWHEEYGVSVIRDRARVLLPTPRVARAIRKMSKNSGIEIGVFGAAAPLGLLAPSLRASGVEHIVALTHGHEVWWAKVFPFSLALSKIARSVDVLTHLGNFTKNEISQSFNSQSAHSMEKLAPGIDTSHFAPDPSSSLLRNELGLSSAKVIVSVGRLVHRKGQDRLIQALPAIRQKIPNAHLLLVGEGPYRKKLEALAHKSGVTDAVTFIGRVQYSDLPQYICVGDIFAMPCRSRFAGLEVEGLGIVYLEASACGLPVIAGNSGGAPDAVLDGITGVVVDGENLAAISKAIVDLLSNPEKAHQMGIAGRNWIIEEWSWDRWAKRFWEILKITR